MRTRELGVALMSALALGGCAHPLQGALAHLIPKAGPPPPKVDTVCPGFAAADVPAPPKIPDAAGFKAYLNQREFDVLTKAGIPELTPLEGKARFDAYAGWLTQAGTHDAALYKRSVNVQRWCAGTTSDKAAAGR